jgi:alpha-galactosidase/6-phospho-beta-glucosidase family protein
MTGVCNIQSHVLNKIVNTIEANEKNNMNINYEYDIIGIINHVLWIRMASING